ncbi:MAG: hypothetical protein R3C17_10660 [Planctomycetaceae bacterium]
MDQAFFLTVIASMLITQFVVRQAFKKRIEALEDRVEKFQQFLIEEIVEQVVKEVIKWEQEKS